MTTQDKKYAAGLLDKLKDLDAQTSRAFYEMGQILYTLWAGKTHQLLGYPSHAALIDEELSFSHATAIRYRQTYEKFQQLKYKKAEALKLIKDHGWTNVAKVLTNETRKLGTLAMKRKIDALDMVQINFQLSVADHEEAVDTLIDWGAEETEQGRLQHSAEAFMDIIRSS